MMRGLIDAHRTGGSAQLPSTRWVTAFHTASGSRATRAVSSSAIAVALSGIVPPAMLSRVGFTSGSPMKTLEAAHRLVFKRTASGPQVLPGICTGRYCHGEIVAIGVVSEP